MIIPTTESTLRMTLMQLSETKLELTAVTEQRDGLHELHNKNAARSKELLELCGTLREQRDRLAEACKALMKIVGEPNSTIDDCWVSEDEMDAAWNMGNEALAAVKGGSDE